MIRLLRVDQLVLGGYRFSAAKKAAAFFRNSFSSRSLRFSRSSSRSRSVLLSAVPGACPPCLRLYVAIQHHTDGLVLELLRERLSVTQLSFPSGLPQL